MDDFNSIGGLLQSGEGGGSGNYYIYAKRNQKPPAKPSPLKQGEIIIGSIVEIISEEIAKVKLPTGTFSASIHKQLVAGDTLFLFVQQVVPNLILKVHSVSSTVNRQKLLPHNILRILDLPTDDMYVDIASFVLTRKSRILRNDLLEYATILNEKQIEKKKYNRHQLLECLFALSSIQSIPSLENIELIYAVFSNIQYIYELIREMLRAKVALNSKKYQFSKDHILEIFNVTNTSTPTAFEKMMNFQKSYHYFIDMIRNKPASGYHFFCFKFGDKFILFKTTFIPVGTNQIGYTAQNYTALPNFELILQNIYDKVEIMLSDADKTILEKTLELLSSKFAKHYHSNNLQITNLEAYSDHFGYLEFSSGEVISISKNFSVVV